MKARNQIRAKGVVRRFVRSQKQNSGATGVSEKWNLWFCGCCSEPFYTIFGRSNPISPSVLPFLLPLILYNVCDVTMSGTPLWSVLGHLSCLCPLPTSQVSSALSPGWRCEKQGRPWICAIPAQQQQKYL